MAQTLNVHHTVAEECSHYCSNSCNSWSFIVSRHALATLKEVSLISQGTYHAYVLWWCSY